MDKQAQDKLWNDLSEENRKTLQFEYQDYIDDIEDSEVCDIERANLEGRVKVMKALFGTHNLNPAPPTPKTWEEVEKEYKAKGISTDYYVNFECGMEEGIADKMIATAKIAKLIELSYGGMVSEEEWKKSSSYEREDAIWTIECEYKKNYNEPQFRIVCGWEQVCFLAFHSKELAEEFMAHESNRKLVEQYHLL